MFETELIASGDDILFGELTSLGGTSENPSFKNSWDASPSVSYTHLRAHET